MPASGNGANDGKNLLHHDGRQAHRGFVEQQLGAAHQGAADGQHLLLAAGQGAGSWPARSFGGGEEAMDVVEVGGDGGLVAADKGAHGEVFGHGQVGKDAAPSGTRAMPSRIRRWGRWR